MLLSILIPSIPRHSLLLAKLLESLSPQPDSIEILVDNGDEVVGIKRNRLLQQAKGDYISYIDADDSVASNYIALILAALETRPDCVGINGIMTTNGVNEKKWFISKEYNSWYEENGIYYRCTNHLAPVRREIAMQVGFPELSHGEDYRYSMDLRGLLHTEVIIRQPIYHYQYICAMPKSRIPRRVIKRR